MPYGNPQSYDDIIDSRDVIDRITELEAEELEALRDEDKECLTSLRKLAEEGETLDDWAYGVTLVRDSFFTEYAQQFAEEIGAFDPDASWPNGYIDWERAARDLQVDYTPLDLAGVTYWAQ